MISYPYNVQKQPPAPFVRITLRHPRSGAEVRDIPAQIDSAADQTLVPLAVAQAIALDKIGSVDIAGVGGTKATLPVYDVLLAIQPLPLRIAEVVAHPNEPWALLGRDILNGYRVVMDGPSLILEIG
ncbi:MAG: hypothetical protein K2X87_02335 [Gemmataceae bacterium]|nr:hypothetical protein [Gemmataceae bacterium]